MKKVTQWFEPSEKPVRVGVYQTRPVPNNPRIFYQYWNGTYWGGVSSALTAARHICKFRSVYQLSLWRGLANPPEQSK